MTVSFLRHTPPFQLFWPMNILYKLRKITKCLFKSTHPYLYRLVIYGDINTTVAINDLISHGSFLSLVSLWDNYLYMGCYLLSNYYLWHSHAPLMWSGQSFFQYTVVNK